jgi:penicillin V acylase-like amidase (Ntn superfamily)
MKSKLSKVTIVEVENGYLVVHEGVANAVNPNAPTFNQYVEHTMKDLLKRVEACFTDTNP